MVPVLPYGTWPSPVSVEDVVSGSRRRRWLVADGADLYWVESDPERDGRSFLRRQRAGEDAPHWLCELAVRSRIHSFGGRPFDVGRGRVVAVGDADQRLYLVEPDAPARALTPDDGARRAAPAWDARAHRVALVRERLDATGAADEIVLVEVEGPGDERVVASGHDFYGAPALSPDGRRLAVVAWDHPSMPWDSALLLEVDLATGETRELLGGPGESVTQPRYAPDGALLAISDRTGWWNLYRRAGEAWSPVRDEPAEFCGPPWLVGEATYAPRPDGSIVVTWTSEGLDHVGVVGRDGALEEIPGPWSAVESVAATGEVAAVLSSGPHSLDDVVRVDRLSDGVPVTVVDGASALTAAWVSTPRVLDVATPEGPVHALYYPPTSPDATGPAGTAPPAVLHAHSGPTRRALAQFDLGIQFWTSRGYAYLDVNYGGSAGFGRPYRERLNGRWGVVDVDDCAACVAAAAARGLLDPARVVSIGSSASGVTTLGLARRGVLAAASLRYPVADLHSLARAPARFEAHYLDTLVGPLPAADALYDEGSALAHAEEIATPLALFHGADDDVVPLEHSLALARALDARGVPHCLTVFEGEGHGFRRPSSWRREAEIELAFFTRVLGLGELDPAIDLTILHADALDPLDAPG